MIRQVALPASREDVRSWRIGDTVTLSGRLYTARDAAHSRMLAMAADRAHLPFDPTGMPVFHCGPVAKRTPDGWQIVSAGPTTSARMESLEAAFIEAFHTPIIIGKGGMGEQTRGALARLGGAYLEATGGSGALGAVAIEEVENVYWLEELGMPEAVWFLRVKEYGPLLVTMDSTGATFRRRRAERA